LNLENIKDIGTASGTYREEDYKKFSCNSCAFVYDESKGFKKRFPAGTRFQDIQVIVSFKPILKE
jgi:hypothetical protein